MHARELTELLHASPFRPFTLYLPNDRRFSVPHPDFAWMTPAGRTLVVATEDKEGINLLDVAMIARVEVPQSQQQG